MYSFTQILKYLSIIVVFYLLIWIIVHRNVLKQKTEEYLLKIRRLEGMEGDINLMREKKKYLFSPNKPNYTSMVEFTVDDFQRESIAVLKLFKLRKHLVSEKANAPAVSRENVPKMSPGVKRPDFISKANTKNDVDQISRSIRGEAAAPSPPPSESFTGMDDASEYGEVSIVSTDIYKYFMELNDNADEFLKHRYGKFFDMKTWQHTERTKMAFSTALKQYDEVYDQVKYYCLNSDQQDLTNTNRIHQPFILYWVNTIMKYRKSSVKMEELQKTFMEIMKPTFVFTLLFAEFQNNIGKYSAKTDALFMINKAIDILSDETPKPKVKVSELGSVYTFMDDDKDRDNSLILYDAILMTNVALVMSLLYKLVENNTPHFIMSKQTFHKVYTDFLDKNKEKKYPGIYLLLSKN